MSTDYYAIAKEFVGIPYRHNGRTGDGLDCLGLVYRFYERCGVSIPDNDGADCPADWYKNDPDRLLRGVRQVGREIPYRELKALDLVYFKIGPGVTHVGVMLDSHNFLHVMITQLVHISPLNLRWRRRLAGARRIGE